MRTLVLLSLRRPIVVIVVWAALLVAAAPFASRLAGVLRGSTDTVAGSPSERAAREVNHALGVGSAFVFPVVLTSSTARTADPRFAAAAGGLERALQSAGMRRVLHYWNTGDSTLLGRDGRSALVLVTPPAATYFDAEAMVERIRSTIASAGIPPEFSVKLTGIPSLFHDLDVSSSDDLLRAERIGIPLTLLVLLFVFGAPIAAGLPLLLALGTTMITLATLYVLSRAMPVSIFAQNAVTMIGLGVGVDYALFLVSRCREELAAGVPFRNAVETAAVYASHVVVVSGVAVCTGFLALFLVHISFLHTLAIGGVIVVITSVLMTLTLLPALLLFVGPRINWPRRRPQLRRQTRAESLWSRWGREAMARPVIYLIPALIVLAVFIAPTVRLRAWDMGPRDLSPTMEARQGYDVLERNFAAGWMGPVAVVLKTRGEGTVRTPERGAAIAAIRARLAVDPRVKIAAGQLSADGTSAVILLVPRSSPESREVMDLVRDLRAASWPEANRAGLDVQTGGFSASMLDFDAELFGSLKLVVPLVLGVMFIVLVFAFRSILVPLKAITMNLLSVFAAYGFLVYVFQDGIGASLIGLTPPGGLNSFIVLMLFTILFGLSMDYEVFLLSRIREEYQRSADDRESVVKGLSQTGGLITSAALIMVVLFGSFGFTRLTATREFGLGLAFAVAVDATLIRVVLVPVLMRLMGRANWWFPGRSRVGRSLTFSSLEPTELQAD
ncbi:MAG TPA: MMPL family transporter [Gemmatimonadaceae bacterium]